MLALQDCGFAELQEGKAQGLLPFLPAILQSRLSAMLRRYRAAPGLYHWPPLRTERTRVRLVGRQRDLEQRGEGDVESRSATTPIHNRRGPHDLAPGGFGDLHRFTRG